jgi:hypothetical protein
MGYAIASAMAVIVVVVWGARTLTSSRSSPSAELD